MKRVINPNVISTGEGIIKEPDTFTLIKFRENQYIV